MNFFWGFLGSSVVLTRSSLNDHSLDVWSEEGFRVNLKNGHLGFRLMQLVLTFTAINVNKNEPKWPFHEY